MDKSTAPNYIRENFYRDDHIAVVLIKKPAVEQRIEPAEKVVTDEYQAWLRHMNATGHEVYIGMATFRPGSSGRTKQDVAEIKHVFQDFDVNGAGALKSLLERRDIPKPNYIIESSPGRFQTIWKVEGFTREKAEGLMIGMGRELGGDPAVHDVTRVMRLPGFFNHKRDTPHLVTVQKLANQVWTPVDFPTYSEQLGVTREHRFGVGTPRPPNAPISQSERDWADVNRALAQGKDPNEIMRELAAKSTRKPDPEYYAERTVVRAMHEQARRVKNSAGHGMSM